MLGLGIRVNWPSNHSLLVATTIKETMVGEVSGDWGSKSRTLHLPHGPTCHMKWHPHSLGFQREN